MNGGKDVTSPKSFWARFACKRLAALSLAYLALIVVVTLLANAVAPYSAEQQDLTDALGGPNGAHWLGTSVLGKDVLSELIYGGRVTLLGVLITVLVFTGIGIPAGMLAGYRGGWFDRFVLKSADLLFAVPMMIVVLVVLAIFPHDEAAAMAAYGLVGAPGLARVVRSATLGVRGELYVRAAVASGIPDRVILRRHVLPRVIGPIINQTTTFGAGAVIMETGLGFLSLGNTGASWGNLVAAASTNLGNDPWLLVPSGFTVISFILAFNLMGDGVRDALAERHTPAQTHRRHPRAAKLSPVPHAPHTATAGAAESDDIGDSLLAVRGLTVRLPIDGAATEVVQDISFDVRPGEALGIVGESGCGKTVTATSLLGLLPAGGQITAGSILFDGIDLTRADKTRVRRIRGGRIGWISQDPISSLDPSFTAGSQVAEAFRAHTDCSRRQAKARVLELFERVRLPDPARVAKSYPHQLSGGMAQRVGIAAALACDPVLVIADEPTTALDVTVQAEILELLREMQAEGTGVILITHDWGVVADLCQRAVVMYAGQIVEEAEVIKLVREPAHPYTRSLLRSDPHYSTRGQALPALEGSVPGPAHWPVGCHFQNRCPMRTDNCCTAPIPITRLGAEHRQTRCIHHPELIGGGVR